MRHPPLACRRAVQTLQAPTPQYISISDHPLDCSLNRFSRALCPHHRRHGSHVPGPLEARRRATKRQMTIPTNFAPQNPLLRLFNVGALFSLHKDTTPSWKYEPPSLPQNVKRSGSVTDASPSTCVSQPVTYLQPISDPHLFSWNWPPQAHNKAYVARNQVEGNSKEALDTVAQPATVQASQNALDQASEVEARFQDFTSRVSNAASLPPIEQQLLFRAAYHKCCPSPSKASTYNVKVIRHIVKMRCNPAAVFQHSQKFARPSLFTEESQELLESLERAYQLFPESRQHFRKVYIWLAESAVRLDRATNSSQDAQLLLLIQRSWPPVSLKSDNVERLTEMMRSLACKLNDKPVQRLLKLCLMDMTKLAENIMRMIQYTSNGPVWVPSVERTLICLPQGTLRIYAASTTLQLVEQVERKIRRPKSVYKQCLSIWLGLLHHVDVSNPSQTLTTNLFNLALTQISICFFKSDRPIGQFPDVLANALIIKMRHQGLVSTSAASSLSAFLRDFPCFVTDDTGQAMVEETFASMLASMGQEGLPYDKLTEQIASLMAQHGDLGLLLRFLGAIERHGLKLRECPIIDKVVVDNVTAVRQAVSTASRSRQQHAFMVQTCQRIFNVLSRISSPSASSISSTTKADMIMIRTQHQVQHILDQAHIIHALPIAYRHHTADMSLPERIVLIHQLAYHYSLDMSRSHQAVWRSVYYLYRHLTEHGLPMGSLFTRALVRVSIIRPLIENRFVSARRMLWVCEIVQRVEGKEAAQSLEHEFWRWRGALFQHAKERYVRAGGDPRDKAHVGTMKKLGLI